MSVLVTCLQQKSMNTIDFIPHKHMLMVVTKPLSCLVSMIFHHMLVTWFWTHCATEDTDTLMSGL